MKVKYIGESFFLSLTNQKIYDVLEVDDDLIRVIDDEEEDYLYCILRPRPLDRSSIGGIWEIVEDTEDKLLEKALLKNIEKYNSKGNDFEKFKMDTLSKYNR